MRPSLRFLAPTVTKPASTSSRPANSRLRKRSLPSLEQFIQRQRAIALYRTILRSLFRIPRSQQDKRDAMIAHAKGEFERNKHVDDITQIRYLISTGKTDFQGMERYIDELAHR